MNDLQRRLRYLVQEDRSVKEYFKEFEKIKNMLNLDDQGESTMNQFLDGLDVRIATRIETKPYRSLEELFQLVVRTEQRLKKPKSPSTIEKNSKPTKKVEEKPKAVSEKTSTTLLRESQEKENKEKPPDLGYQIETQEDGKSVTPRTTTNDQAKGVILSYLLKGEPLDAPHITKPKQYQGKTLSSQKRMKTNFLSLDAGSTILRIKSFQEGGDDTIMASVISEEEVEAPQQAHEKPQQDIHAYQGVYRRIKEELTYTLNCSRNYTHQGLMS
ncbi:unnamed protein product, partial [Cochlearia groenlandica]